MEKNEIVNDVKFKQRCGAYGLNWTNCELYDDVILLNTPTEDLYVLFDKNYNTIGVVNWKGSKDDESIKRLHLSTYCYEYSTYSDIMPFGCEFSYPFENFSLKQIIDLSNRIEIMETHLCQPLLTIINGDSYDRNLQENEEYFQLASYVKFLGEEIKKYYLLSYQMQCLGYKFPDVYSYIKNIMKKVNECIDFYIERKEIKFSPYILSSIGQNSRELNMNGILTDVTNVLLKNRGYQIKKGTLFEIEPVQSLEERKDLSIIAQELLEILKLSDEELRLKEEKRNQELLGDLIEQDGPRLVKKPQPTKKHENK